MMSIERPMDPILQTPLFSPLPSAPSSTTTLEEELPQLEEALQIFQQSFLWSPRRVDHDTVLLPTPVLETPLTDAMMEEEPFETQKIEEPLLETPPLETPTAKSNCESAPWSDEPEIEVAPRRRRDSILYSTQSRPLLSPREDASDLLSPTDDASGETEDDVCSENEESAECSEEDRNETSGGEQEISTVEDQPYDPPVGSLLPSVSETSTQVDWSAEWQRLSTENTRLRQQIKSFSHEDRMGLVRDVLLEARKDKLIIAKLQQEKQTIQGLVQGLQQQMMEAVTKSMERVKLLEKENQDLRDQLSPR